MKEYLVIENQGNSSDITDFLEEIRIIGIFQAKNKKQAMGKIWNQFDEVCPDVRKYITNQITGKDAGFFASELCYTCEWEDPDIGGGCIHKCVRSKEDWYNEIYLPYFETEERTQKFLNCKTKKQVTEIVNFIMNKEKEESLKWIQLIDIKILPLFGGKQQ